MPDEDAAVIVPPGLKAGFSLSILATSIFCGPSSRPTELSPWRLRTGTATISSSNQPCSAARWARPTLALA